MFTKSDKMREREMEWDEKGSHFFTDSKTEALALGIFHLLNSKVRSKSRKKLSIFATLCLWSFQKINWFFTFFSLIFFAFSLIFCTLFSVFYSIPDPFSFFTFLFRLIFQTLSNFTHFSIFTLYSLRFFDLSHLYFHGDRNPTIYRWNLDFKVRFWDNN